MSEQFTAADAERFRTHHLAETSRLTREVLELRAELATARRERDEMRAIIDSGKGQSAVSILWQQLDESRRTVERLRAALLKQAHEPEGELCWCHTPVCTHQPACKAAREALSATPAPVVPKPYDWPEDFSHENGNYMSECVLCHQEFIGHKRRTICKLCAHAVVSLADAESLAAALNDALIALPYSIDRGAARDALLVYRHKHPAPKEPLL